jgi:hypothetical protein
VDIPFVTLHVMVHNAYSGFKGHCFFYSKVPVLFESVIAFLDGVSSISCTGWRNLCRCFGGWMDGWMGGWMGGWMDGWMVGWVDEWMNG